MPAKRHLSLKDFFLSLCPLKNEVGWVQAPGDHSLIGFISEKTEINPQTTLKKINELVKLGYIQKGFRKHILWRIEVLIPEWNEDLLHEKQKKEKSESAAQTDAAASTENPKDILFPTAESGFPKPVAPQEKRFAVFMDYVNLEKGLKRSPDKFRDFSWLINPILEQGKLSRAFVFIPEHYVGRASIMQLVHKHRFQPILCPRQIQTGGSITKDADTVDAQLIDLATWVIDHSDITNIVIISGDADFQPLITHAIWQQKKVTVWSGPESLSSRLTEMAKDGSLSIQLI